MTIKPPTPKTEAVISISVAGSWIDVTWESEDAYTTLFDACVQYGDVFISKSRSKTFTLHPRPTYDINEIVLYLRSLV